MPGSENAARDGIETPVAAVVWGVPKEDARCGSAIKFVVRLRGEVGEAKATKDTKEGVVGWHA